MKKKTSHIKINKRNSHDVADGEWRGGVEKAKMEKYQQIKCLSEKVLQHENYYCWSCFSPEYGAARFFFVCHDKMTLKLVFHTETLFNCYELYGPTQLLV